MRWGKVTANGTGYTPAMQLRVVLFLFLSACITDDGEIDEACDEIQDPCIWETVAEDPDDAEDTGPR
jgi:hypothetical protein